MLIGLDWNQVKPTEVWIAINGTATWLLVLVGAVIGYLRFVRRREMHASCELEVHVKMVKVGSGHALHVLATAKNDGSYRLQFPVGSHQLIAVASADHPMWEDSQRNSKQMLWSMADEQKQELLETEGARDSALYLDPGVRLIRSLIFPIDLGDSVAFKVLMTVEACPKGIAVMRRSISFSTETILLADGKVYHSDGR